MEQSTDIDLSRLDEELIVDGINSTEFGSLECASTSHYCHLQFPLLIDKLHYLLNLIPKSHNARKKRKQPTLTNIFNRVNKFKKDDYRAKEIDKHMAKMICLDLISFSIVENRGFSKLIPRLDLRYRMP